MSSITKGQLQGLRKALKGKYWEWEEAKGGPDSGGKLFPSGNSAEERRKVEPEGAHGRQRTERGGKVWDTEAADDPTSVAFPLACVHLHTFGKGWLAGSWLVSGDTGQHSALGREAAKSLQQNSSDHFFCH